MLSGNAAGICLVAPNRRVVALTRSACGLQESQEWDEWVRTAFDVFDVDGRGRLSVDELNKLLCGDVCAVRPTCDALRCQAVSGSA